MNNQSPTPIPSKDENPNGLHAKYRIQIFSHYTADNNYTADNSSLLKQDIPVFKDVDLDAEYFVLRLDTNGDDPNHIAACREAIHTYAAHIQEYHSQLAADLRKRYPLLKTAGEYIPVFSSNPTDQTAETIDKRMNVLTRVTEEHCPTHELKRFCQFSGSQYGIVLAAMKKYADLRIRENLEAAAKELPTFRRLSFLHFPDRDGSERDEVERLWVKYFEAGCIKMSEQAALVIAHKDEQYAIKHGEEECALNQLSDMGNLIDTQNLRIKELEDQCKKLIRMRDEVGELLAYLKIHGGIEEQEGEQILMRLREAIKETYSETKATKAGDDKEESVPH